MSAGGPDVIIIRKKPKGHAAHSAAWKVAYADFVTAMMALFMVLWLVSQTDQAMRKSLSEYFRTGVFSGAPSVLEGGMGIADHGFIDTAANPPVVESLTLQRNVDSVRSAVNRAVSQPGLEKLAEHVVVRATEGGVLLQIADGRDDMLFDVSSAELKPALVQLLTEIAPTLGKLGYGLELHGHTDARPFPPGSVKNNWSLSFMRAESARMELERGGVPAELIAGVYAHGATLPADPKDPKSPVNRRLAIFARPLARPDEGAAKPAGSGEAADDQEAGSEKTEPPKKPGKSRRHD
jgi:chemotaxis protein MotB